MMTIGPFNASAYSLLVGAGVLIALFYPALRYRLTFARPVGPVVDVLLAGLVGGLLLARAAHVLLHWAYFAGHPAEITQLGAGGLNWHGAVLGALMGMFIMARFRRVALPPLLDSLALVLPLMVFLAWWGCAVAHCSYGAEVERLTDYPRWMVWEARDIFNIIAPRYATQPLGMAFALVMGAALLLTARRGWLVGRRFWLGLLLLAGGMLGLGALRGDHAGVWAGLYADQWLDAGMLLLAMVMLYRPLKYTGTKHPQK